MRRMRYVDEADLFAGAVEVDGGAGGGHAGRVSVGEGSPAEPGLRGGRGGGAQCSPAFAHDPDDRDGIMREIKVPGQIGGRLGRVVPIHFCDSADSEPSSMPRWI